MSGKKKPLMHPRSSPLLPGGVERRKPYPSEDAYFRKNPNVGGMAAEDDRVIINPHSKLTAAEKKQVAINEAARVTMRRDPKHAPKFNLTPRQQRSFARYGSETDKRATVAARILSGDPSAGNATPKQQEHVRALRTRMGLVNPKRKSR